MAIFILDCSSAHEPFATDALMAQKMNMSSGGVQPKMHETINPTTGKPQAMCWPGDYNGVGEDDKSLAHLAGLLEGMEQVLCERGLLDSVASKLSGKKISVCTTCKLSQKARDKAAKLAKAQEQEIDCDGLAGLADCYEYDGEVDDLERSHYCCMQRVLSLQPGFLAEKPLLQLVIEKAGHKCIFFLQYHCELNPIKMVWGQTKQRECS